MMNSLPAAVDALYQTTTVHVTDSNDADITWIVEVTFVSWDGENWVILGGKEVNMFIAIQDVMLCLTNYFVPNF
jgi:hypothetical protein